MIDNAQIVFVLMTNQIAHDNRQHHYHHHKVQVYMAKVADEVSQKFPNSFMSWNNNINYNYYH